MLLTDSGATCIVSKRGRSIPKHTVICGVGTGKFVAMDATGEGLPLTWEHGDKSLVQIDHSSINPENTNFEVMSLYRLLVLLEKKKKIQKYDVSFTNVARKVGAGEDGFDVSVKSAMKFVSVEVKSENEKARTSKSWFFNNFGKLESSPIIKPVFRFKYERVQGILKAQRPYCVTKIPLTLKAGSPVKARP